MAISHELIVILLISDYVVGLVAMHSTKKMTISEIAKTAVFQHSSLLLTNKAISLMLVEPGW